MNKKIEEIPDAAMEAMTRYSWPGNIRELQNFIERPVILSPGRDHARSSSSTVRSRTASALPSMRICTCASLM
jgi:DNA-binding NtrC family response regulator